MDTAMQLRANARTRSRRPVIRRVRCDLDLVDGEDIDAARERVKVQLAALGARDEDGFPVPEDYIDFGAIARLIDGVASRSPEELGMLLEVLWRSNERETARAVLLIAGQAEDPLSELGEVCQDGLRTAAALEKLCNAEAWENPATIVEKPRVTALYRLLSARLQDKEELAEGVARRYRQIKARLWQHAEIEARQRADQIDKLAAIRDAQVPDLWAIYEAFGKRVG